MHHAMKETKLEHLLGMLELRPLAAENEKMDDPVSVFPTSFSTLTPAIKLTFK